MSLKETETPVKLRQSSWGEVGSVSCEEAAGER